MPSRKSMFFISAGIAAAFAVAAVLFNPIMIRHFAVLLTFGRVPGLQALRHTCPIKTIHSRSRRYDHCFDKNGRIFEHDAQHNDTAMRVIMQQALKDKCAVLIARPFKDHKCYERLKEASTDKSLMVRAKLITPAEMYQKVDRYFGTGQALLLARNRTATPMGLGALLDEYEQGPSMKFTAFDNGLGIGVYSKVWDFDLSWLSGHVGSTFLSNYNTTFVTTPFHSACWDSLAYQCVGTKTWKMLTPDDALPTVRFFGTGFTYMAECNDVSGLSELTFDVVSGPDTLFYFPPYWAHAVKTEAGLSVLLNYRVVDFLGILRKDFLVGLHSMIGIFYYRNFFLSYGPDEITYYYLTGEKPALQGGSTTGKKQFWHN